MIGHSLGDTYSDPIYPDQAGAPWEEWGLTEAALYQPGSGLGARSCWRSLLALGGPIN